MSSYPAHQPQYETRQEYLREPSSYSGGPDGSDEYADARQQSQHAYHDSHSQTALNAGQPMYSNADPSYDDLLAEKEMMQQQQQQQQRQSQFAMDEGANPRMSAYSRAGGPGGLAPSHLRSSMAGANGPRPTSQWTVGFEPPPKSTGILRMWRKENRAGWARGGGFRTGCRFFSCCFLTFIFLLVSVILTILLWVRPPNIQLKGVQIPSSNAVSVTSTSELSIKFNLDISVTNPNWFSADFSSITAKAYYPGNSNQFGGGSLSNIKFPGNSGTTFQFPFTLNYTTAMDPSGTILKDLIAKCSASPAQDITVDYDLTLALKIIAVNISPTISSSATFQCPVSASDLSGIGSSILGGSG